MVDIVSFITTTLQRFQKTSHLYMLSWSLSSVGGSKVDQILENSKKTLIFIRTQGIKIIITFEPGTFGKI